MIVDLKPCPFCGGGLIVLEDRGDNGCEPVLHRPQCRRCGGGLGDFDNRAAAVAAWNRRTPDPALLEAANALSEVEGENARLRGMISAREKLKEALGIDSDQLAVETARVFVVRAQSAERERDQWRETSNGHRDDAEQFRRERDEALSRVGELEGVLKRIGPALVAAEVLMEKAGHWRNSSGYLTDAALWIDKASNATVLALSPTRGGGDQEASSQKPTTSAAHGVPARAAPTAEANGE